MVQIIIMIKKYSMEKVHMKKSVRSKGVIYCTKLLLTVALYPFHIEPKTREIPRSRLSVKRSR